MHGVYAIVEQAVCESSTLLCIGVDSCTTIAAAALKAEATRRPASIPASKTGWHSTGEDTCVHRPVRDVRAGLGGGHRKHCSRSPYNFNFPQKASGDHKPTHDTCICWSFLCPGRAEFVSASRTSFSDWRLQLAEIPPWEAPRAPPKVPDSAATGFYYTIPNLNFNCATAMTANCHLPTLALQCLPTGHLCP